MEEKVYYRYMEEHNQGQGHLGESGVVMTLNYIRKGVEGRGGKEEPGAAARSPKVQKGGHPKGWII